MENQAMSSSSSSTPKPQKLKGLAMEEKATENKNESPQEVTSERRSEENSQFRSDVVGTGREIMKFYSSKSNKIYACHFCKKGFSTSQALGGHQNAHKHERDWEKKRKEMEENFPGLAFLNPYLDKPHLLLGGYSQDALSNENHLGITLEPFKPIGHTRGIMDMNMNMNMAIVPRVTPTCFFTGNTSTRTNNGSSINRPLISRNVSPFPPPRTNILSNGLFPQENVLSEKNLISKVGMRNIVEIDDDDDDEEEEKKSKKSGVDLSLSL